jgi:hypothetical protein
MICVLGVYGGLWRPTYSHGSFINVKNHPYFVMTSYYEWTPSKAERHMSVSESEGNTAALESQFRQHSGLSLQLCQCACMDGPLQPE